MAGRLGVAVLVAMLAAACGSPVTTPPPATPSPTPDPRHDALDQAQATWDAKRPKTVAYTTTQSIPGQAATSVRLSEMDGRTEALVLTAGPVAPADDGRSLSIDATFATAHEAVDGSGAADFDVDQLTGYLPRLEYTTDAADGSFAITVDQLVTAADRTAAGAARDALADVLDRWSQLASPAWDYTWTRFTAADTDSTAATWQVRHGDGRTTLATSDGSEGPPPPAEATIQGTVEAAVAVMASGGWVDVAIDPVGLDTLLAFDPSPSVAGDAWWIRIDYTDRFAERARQALDAARTRWSAADLRRYSYRWTWDGVDGSWWWGVNLRGDSAKLKPSAGAPTVESSFVAPRIDELFTLIDQVLASGGSVDASYDRALGYPTRVELTGQDQLAPRGVITITRLRER